MLQKKESKSVTKLKYVAIIPLLIVMVTLTAFSQKLTTGKETTQSIIKEQKNTLEKKVTQVDSTKKGIPFATVDRVPTMESCKSLTDVKAIKKCFSDEIKKNVNKNFNIKIADQLNLTGVNRIYTKFTIDTTGTIVDIESRGPHPKLEEEAKRVIALVPKMIAGEHKGKKVSVHYSLPIVFKVAALSDEKKEEKQVAKQNSIKGAVPLVGNLSGIKGNDIKNGYYLITHICKNEESFKKGIASLKEQGFQPKSFKNPQDSYDYVYLEKYNTLEEAKKMLLSNFEGKYKKELYILEIK